MHWQLPESLQNVKMDEGLDIPKRRVLLVLEVAACLEEGPVLGAVPKGRVNPPPDHLRLKCSYYT